MFANIIILASIGLAVSIYAYTLEKRVKEGAAQGNQGYKPACDISERVSCSKPILSPYGSLFGISNSIFGMVIYASILICAFLGMGKAVALISLAACLASVVFAFILFTKIKVLCLVCASLYLINALLLWASWPFLTL